MIIIIILLLLLSSAIKFIALESSGAWCTEGWDFVLELGRRLMDTTLDKLETSYLFQRLGSRSTRERHLLCLDLTMLNCNCRIIIIIKIPGNFLTVCAGTAYRHFFHEKENVFNALY